MNSPYFVIRVARVFNFVHSKDFRVTGGLFYSMRIWRAMQYRVCSIARRINNAH